MVDRSFSQSPSVLSSDLTNAVYRFHKGFRLLIFRLNRCVELCIVAAFFSLAQWLHNGVDRLKQWGQAQVPRDAFQRVRGLKLLFKRKTVRKPITVLLSISMPQVRC